MSTITTSIIPAKQTFAIVNKSHTLNLEAICVFAAIGFFLDEDTYWKDKIVLQPGGKYQLDAAGVLIKRDTYFNWYYEPRNISFEKAVDEFTELFESIVQTQTGDNRVLLPLSGGLDSRTQAVALNHLKTDVHSYSYSLKNGFKEHKIGQQIAKSCGFDFESFLVPPHYLWDVIDEIAAINDCYCEFTNPRQVAVLNHLKQMHGAFSLGHWGDVLFDRGCSEADEAYTDLDIVYKKLVKKGGLVLAKKLWKSWGLDGDFETYLKQRIQDLLDKIDIKHKSAKIRAFKSLYWAPRWTSVSLSFFESAHPINLPYYDNRMCQFICEIPEVHLADRKIQIAYIKNRNPQLANIVWQEHKPYNLFTYQKNKFPNNLPYRLKNKLERELYALMGKKHIQRNWELQFIGKENESILQKHLFKNDFLQFVGSDVVEDIYNKFKNQDAVFYSHPVSMLLTLSLWYANEKYSLS
jgi:hypothetical protein